MLFLPLTNQREKLCADFSTSYLYTSGKCLLLNYLLPYTSISSGILFVYLLDENLDFTLLKAINIKNLPSEIFLKWQMIIIKLPDTKKLQKIYIKFERNFNIFRTSSSIAIDDLSIQPCSSLRKYCYAKLILKQ